MSDQRPIERRPHFAQAVNPREVEAQRKKSASNRRRKFINISGTIALAAAALGSFGFLSTYKIHSSDQQGPNPTQGFEVSRNETLDILRQDAAEIGSEDLFDKYKVLAVSTKAADKALEKQGKNYSELPDTLMDAKWTVDEINTLRRSLDNFPSSLFEPINDVGLTVFKGKSDYMHECECYAATFNKTGFIGFGEGGISSADWDGTMQITSHEFTHRFDALTKQKLWVPIEIFLSGSNYLDLPYFKDQEYFQEIAKRDIGDDVDRKSAVAIFGSFAPDQEFIEGVAGISQLYIRGYERFMRAAGPILDGHGYNKAKLKHVASSKLAEKYPRAFSIYTLYKQEVFVGAEYDQEGKIIKPQK